MSLKLWLPLNGNLDNQGLSSAVITNNGATVNTSGKIGSCYSFDGSDNYISIDCSELYKIFKGGSQQFTIAFWIYHADTTRAVIFGDYRLSGYIDFNVELTASHQIRFYWCSNPDKTFNVPVAVQGWTHCAIVYNGAETCVYKDGILQSDKYIGTLSAQSKTSGSFYLGRDSRTGETALNGKINDFRIYDNALSAKEIAELAKGLVLHYTLSGFGGENLVNTTRPFSFSSATIATIKNGVKTLGVNADTYFRIPLAKTLESGVTYTLSFHASEMPSGGVLKFGLGAASSSSTSHCGIVSVISGYNTYTFTPQIDFSGSILMDDTARTGLPVVEMTHFKIEEGSIATPWIPYSSDALYTAMGLNDNTEYDVSGYRNDAEKHGSITYSSDTPRYVTSSIFDGTSYIASNSLPDEVKTISLWVKTDWLTVSSGYKLLMHDTAVKLCIGFYSNNRFCTYIGTSSDKGTSITYASLYNVNEWNHIVVVITGAKTRDVYINGEKAPTTTTTYFAGSGNQLLIGCRNYNGYKDYFDGQISDFRAYATELSEDDILELYQVGASLANNGVLMAHEFIE